MHDLVIVLPGIPGSVLRKDQDERDGYDVWAMSGRALWGAITSLGDNLQDLALPRHDPRREPPETRLRATRLIDDFHGIFGLWRIDGYDTIVNTIIDNFDIRLGSPDDGNDLTNLLPFPYDWRVSNRASARKLEALVNRRLPAFQKATNNPGAKTVLIAHSMGGLVSRYYLEVLGGWRDCRTLITFGTPYRGAVGSLNYLANGYKKTALGRTLFDLTEVMRSLPAVYELMPRYPALNANGEWKRPAEAGSLPGVDDSYARAALDFHFEIDAAINANQGEPNYTKDPYVIFPVVGARQPTLNSASIEGGKITASELSPEWLDGELAGGDGTVPRVSASPEDREKEFREIFFAERHASLQRNDQVLVDLIERLKQMQAPRRTAARGGVSLAPRPLGLTVEELYLPEEPVELWVNAEDVEPFGAPRASIIGRVTDTPAIHAPFMKSGDRWTTNFGILAPGQYRVRVDTTKSGPGAPTPVHEVFEVAG
jgi:pimeloyl-ACP methyl ester carboxylesterase